MSDAAPAAATGGESWRDRAGFRLALLFVYAIVAAAAFQGYYQKWHFFDGNPAQSVVATIDGTAQRPYVYRQLLPQTATLIERALPEGARRAIVARLHAADGALAPPDGRDALASGHEISYRIVYYLTFASLFAAMFVLRALAIELGIGAAAATIAPALFALTMPILQTRGGYFYDYPELLAFALAALFAWRGWWPALILIAIPAAANKESFLFFAIALVPLLRNRLRMWPALIAAAATAFAAGLAYLWVKQFYAANPGGTAIFQLWANIAFYGNPLNLLKLEQTYGIAFFKGYGIVVIGWFALVCGFGWRTAPAALRRHLRLAAAINLPLLILLCAGGEMRNLSLLFVGAAMLFAGAIQRLLDETVARARPLPA